MWEELQRHYWAAREPRKVVNQTLQENAVRLTNRHILRLDIDGSRFAIADTSALADASRQYVDTIL